MLKLISIFKQPLAVLVSLFFLLHSQTYSIEKESSLDNAFSTIEISMASVFNGNQNQFHDYWEPSTGLELQFEMPFYFGQFEIGMQAANNKGRNEQLPDYLSVNSFIGWGYQTKLSSKFGWYLGFRLGNYYMNFDDDAIAVELKTESEFAVGLKSRIHFMFNKNMSLQLSGLYTTIYTNKRIELSFISVGISKKFVTPLWLRKFLKWETSFFC